MSVALIYVAGSLVFLTLLTVVYVIEDKKGERVFLVGARSAFDRSLTWILSKIFAVGSYFGNSVVRLLLHYGAHSILKRILSGLRSLEKRVEDLVRQNRQVAKSITNAKTRNHLDEIAEHKEEVSLSPKEKEKMLSHE